MKWVAIAIVGSLVLYTALTLFFRKPGRGHEPYREGVQRTTTARLQESGYQQVELELARPADPARQDLLLGGSAAHPTSAAGGFPLELTRIFVQPPLLAERFTRVVAVAETDAGQPYRVQFTATMADHQLLLTSATLFRKGTTLLLLPVGEKLGGNLQARWTDTTIQIVIPGGSLPPGRYAVTLVGARANSTWTLEVK